MRTLCKFKELDKALRVLDVDGGPIPFTVYTYLFNCALKKGKRLDLDKVVDKFIELEADPERNFVDKVLLFSLYPSINYTILKVVKLLMKHKCYERSYELAKYASSRKPKLDYLMKQVEIFFANNKRALPTYTTREIKKEDGSIVQSV